MTSKTRSAPAMAATEYPLEVVELHSSLEVPFETIHTDWAAPYAGGFLGHHVFGPLGLDVRSAAVQAGLYTAAFGLNAVGYGLLLARARRSVPRGSQPASPATAQPATASTTSAPAASHTRRDRTPATAMPMAVPKMADSASGVSKTRFSPNWSIRPSVTRKTPPSRPTSSPITRTRESRSISCFRARLRA